ncbi:MAG: hypothetical protein AAFR16_05585 [Pseudomonadota bacterium]
MAAVVLAHPRADDAAADRLETPIRALGLTAARSGAPHDAP